MGEPADRAMPLGDEAARMDADGIRRHAGAAPDTFLPSVPPAPGHRPRASGRPTRDD